MSKVVTDNIENIAGSNSIPTNKLVNRDAVIGFDQTWTDVTASRSAGVTYTNSTGKPIIVAISVNTAVGAVVTFNLDSVIFTAGANGSSTVRVPFNFIVPDNSTYSITGGSGISQWLELR